MAQEFRSIKAREASVMPVCAAVKSGIEVGSEKLAGMSNGAHNMSFAVWPKGSVGMLISEGGGQRKAKPRQSCHAHLPSTGTLQSPDEGPLSYRRG